MSREESGKVAGAARWGLPALVIVVLAVGGITGLVLVRLDVLATRPWEYVFLACAGFAAVAGFLLGIIRARSLG